MDIILLQNVDKLGKEGDIVHVKDGYARNFILPRKLGIASTPEALKVLERKRKKKEEELEKVKTEAEAVSKKIASVSCTIPVEAGVEDKIFGAVTSDMVKNALKQEGIETDKRDITIKEPIKKLGVYKVDIKLHPEVTAELKIWVVKK